MESRKTERFALSMRQKMQMMEEKGVKDFKDTHAIVK